MSDNKEVIEKKEIAKPKPDFSHIKSGQVVRVSLRIKEINTKNEEKERVQVYEGVVIGRRGGKGMGATITVRKVTDGIGVERIFPLHLPTINNIEVVKEYKTKQAQLPYIKNYGKKLKEKKVKAK